MGAGEVLEVLYVAVPLSGLVWSCLPFPVPLSSDKLFGGAETICPKSQ